MQQATVTMQDAVREKLDESRRRRSSEVDSTRYMRSGGHYAEPLWDYSACAEFLLMSENTLRKLTSQGKVPRIKIGRLVRFSPSAIREWAASSMRKAVDDGITE